MVGTILTCLTMDGQTHAIGKAIRPLFADPVAIMAFLSNLSFEAVCTSYKKCKQTSIRKIFAILQSIGIKVIKSKETSYT